MIVSVTVDGVDRTISPTAGDLVRLERQFGISAAALDEKNVRVEHVLFIAWTALRRDHQIDESIDFESFIDLADVPDSSPLDPPSPRQQT